MKNKASRKSRFLSPGWLMFFSALLCVVLVPVIQAAMRYSGEKPERYRQLTEMTESERLRIQHSFEEFQKLSPAEQESYRELDRRLRHEDLELKDTLASYQEFLSTLSPVDRAKVEQAATKRERLNAIERIQEERANLRQQLETGYSMFEEHFRNADHHRHRREAFSASEMEAIAASIGRRLPGPVKQKYNLDVKTGTVRFAWTVVAALDHWKPNGPSGSGREMFPEDLLEEIVSASQNNDEVMNDFNFARQRDDRTLSRQFLHIAFQTIFREHLKRTPDISELSNFLNTLDAEAKEELIEKDAQKFYGDLVRQYFDINPTEFSKPLDELWKFFRRSRSGGIRGPNGRRDDDRNDDDRRRFDRDRGRDDDDRGRFDRGRNGG